MPNRGFQAAAEPLGVGLAGVVAGLSLLLAAFLVSTGPASDRPDTPRAASRLLEEGRRRGMNRAESATLLAHELAWTRARRTWQLRPSAWRSPLLAQRILLGWTAVEIETAWLEEVATPLAEHLYGRPVEALDDVEAAALVTALESPRGIRWALCSDDPRAESRRNALRSGEVDRPDSWALWCTDPRPP